MADNKNTSGQLNIISLGGSLIVPDDIDTEFLKKFLKFIKDRVSAGERFILITGGGKICRRYQKAVKDLDVADIESNDWIGIYVTRLNAHFLRIILGDLAHDEIIINPSEVSCVTKPVVVAAGWKPGWSTDFDAVELAKKFEARRLVNLSNIDYVYDKDPKQFPDAKKIEKISWAEFRKLIPEKWEPGLNAPFDPIAAKEADFISLEVAIMNGRDIENLGNYFDGKDFVGTVIR